MIISHKYEVVDQLGRGNMGVVYKVRHLTLDTISALKVLRPQLAETPELVKRFHREARVMARLNHPNIVRVVDIDRDDALHFLYFVMDYIQGQTLRQHLEEQGPLPLREVLRITRQVARALEHAHGYTPPVIHRDIKPTNIMIEHGSGRVVVMDFGIAKELDESDMTKAGMMLGTVKYCPPEQLRHEPLDGSADVYALGMVMYEAYTGTQYFAGLSEPEVISKVMDSREYELSFTRPAPPEFVALVTKAIAKSRDQRYQRVAELLKDLEVCWAALYRSETVVNLATTSAEPQLETAQEDLTELEEQFHQEEQEQQRGLVLPLQISAREARERAAHEGAAHLALNLFQQGCAQEENGHESLRREQYRLAREAYEEAARLFVQAYERTVTTKLMQQVEQAQQEMIAAKEKADRYAAKERSQTIYDQGLRLETQAKDLWKHKDYQQAWQVYCQARDIFENAYELSCRALLEEEANAARSQMSAMRGLAIKEKAEELAAQAFQQAAHSAQQADEALQQKEFTQARELYRVACSQYELAQQRARTERLRRHALLAQQQAREAQQEAEVAGASRKQSAYQQAVKAQRRGVGWLEKLAYEQAAQAYKQACQGYQQARQEAEHARRRQAVIDTRQRMEEARASAEQVGARERLGAEFVQAQHLVEQGQYCEAQEDWAQALEHYEQALNKFSYLLEEAKLQAAREQAEAARENALMAQSEAEKVKAAKLFADRFAEARTLLHQAEQKFTQADYSAAHTNYDASTVLFGELFDEAWVYHQREQAEQARTWTQQLQEKALVTRGWKYRRAHLILRQGDRLFQKQNYPQARARFEKAASLLATLPAIPPKPWPWRKIAFVSLFLTVPLSVAVGLYLVLSSYQPSLETLPKIETPLADAKPRITGWSPELEGEITIPEGQSQPFTIKAESPKHSPLRYIWLLDGQPQAEGERWTYQPDFTEAGAKEVRVIVADQNNRTVERNWRIRVVDVNRKPTIESVSPMGDSVELMAGGLREFSVRASDPDQGDSLAYSWFLDGRKVAQGERWQFQAPSSETTHRVTVEIVDRGGLTEQMSWEVSVKPLPLPAGPPKIVKATPELKELSVAEGQSQSFAIKAESPQQGPLRYAWLLDGKKQAEGERWTYQPDFTEASAKPKEVKVVVADQEGQQVERVWRVRVQEVNRPPEIVTASPVQTDLMRIAGGEVQRFSVEASDPDQDERLTYVWSLDGTEVSRATHWQFQAPSSEGRHTVVVTVLDKAGLKAQRRWNVAVQTPTLPPTIIEARPRGGTVTIEAEQPLDFSVTAKLAGSAREAGKALRYQWSFDNASPFTEERGQFRMVEPKPGKHRLTVVAVSPEGLKSLPRSWTIQIHPRQLGITEAEVRDWLKTYQRAWEGKDVDTLVAMGEVSSQHAPRLHEVLFGYKDFRVAFEDVQIRIEGNQATVTFQRVDTIDGKTLPQPGRKVFVLQKRSDGRIARLAK